MFLSRKIKRLIVPLYLWNMFYALVIMILKYKVFFINTQVNLYTLIVEPMITGHQFLFNLAGWFIFPLFFAQIAFLFLHKKCKNLAYNESCCFLFCILLGVIGVELSIKGYNVGYYLPLVRFVYFLPFYALGYYYRTVLEKYDCFDSIKYFTFIMMVCLLIVFIYGHPLTYEIVWCRNFNEGVLVPLFVPVVGIAFWLRISKIAEPAIGKSFVINILANNTYDIMIHHIMGFFV